MSGGYPGQSVFEKTYLGYLKQLFDNISRISSCRLGVSVRDNEICIPLLNRYYTVTSAGITGPDGKRPSFDICVIILKYLLTDRYEYSSDKNWCAFRDLKDSKPLTSYFRDNVEDAFIKAFSGRLNYLKTNCLLSGAFTPSGDFNSDISMQFNLLPRIPVLLLFNDMDEEFPSNCSVLFEQRAENYLDAECLAMTGRFLFESIVNVN